MKSVFSQLIRNLFLYKKKNTNTHHTVDVKNLLRPYNWKGNTPKDKEIAPLVSK